jgi:hypothetical protein
MVDERRLFRLGNRSFGRGSGRRGMALVLRVLFVASILVSVTGCSILKRDGASTLGSESSLEGEALLVCSRDCADRGQCGTAEQGKMVLLSSAGPATAGHNMAIADGTNVSIVLEQQTTVIRVATGEPENASFYQVNIPERGQGWAAGWCVGQ